MKKSFFQFSVVIIQLILINACSDGINRSTGQGAISIKGKIKIVDVEVEDNKSKFYAFCVTDTALYHLTFDNQCRTNISDKKKNINGCPVSYFNHHIENGFNLRTVATYKMTVELTSKGVIVDTRKTIPVIVKSIESVKKIKKGEQYIYKGKIVPNLSSSNTNISEDIITIHVSETKKVFTLYNENSIGEFSWNSYVKNSTAPWAVK